MTVKKDSPVSHSHPHEVELLKKFGLTTNEALIYLYLIERGTEAGGSKISDGTKLHRQYVYLCLERLLEIGLVVPIQHGKQRRYLAQAPIELEKIAKRRVTETGDLVRELNKLSTIGNEQEFEILQGNRSICNHEMDYAENAKNGEEEYIIGGSSTGFIAMMGSYLDEYLKIKTKKRITVKYLGSINELRLYEKFMTQEFQNQEYRFLTHLPQKSVHMTIRNDTVGFYSFLNPQLLYVIKSPSVASNYKDFFMMLWNNADKL